MSTCPNCRTEVETGMKFCGECGAPIPQVKKCIKCGIELPLKMKFCFECGAMQAGTPTNASISMGDKNVIAGDVVGQKVAGDNVQSKIMGNAIYNTFQDETKRVINCHVCGKHLTNDNGHTCPNCGNVVCDKHFDTSKNLCLKCAEIKKQDALQQYKAKLMPICADGRIDIIERNILDKLAQDLGLSKEETQSLERKYLLQTKVSAITRTEQLSLDNVKKSFFTDEFETVFGDLKKLYERYPSNDEIVSWYLRFARVINPDETMNAITKLQGEFCEAYLSLICIYMAKNQMSEAEIALNKAKQVWPDNQLVKCMEALFLIKLFKMTNNHIFVDEAANILQNVVTHNEYEEFLVSNEKILLAYFQEGNLDLNALSPRFFMLFRLGFTIAKDGKNLKALIKNAIDRKGPKCNLNFIDVSNVTDMSHLFEGSIFDGDVSEWNVSNVTNMKAMFKESQFSGDLCRWEINKNADMTDMFVGSCLQNTGRIPKWYSFATGENIDSKLCPKTKDELKKIVDDLMKQGITNLNSIDVSAITDMSNFFEGTKFNGDISQWNVSNVENMESMFANTPFNGDISKWNVSKVKNMRNLFYCSKFNGNISKWEVLKVEDMSGLFSHSSFNGDISKWDVSKVKNMAHMFCKSKFWGDISKWDVSNVVCMKYMFQGSKFNGLIGDWNVSNVIDMEGMFQDSQFGRDLSNWNVSKVLNMKYMFQGSKCSTDLNHWRVAKSVEVTDMFKNCNIGWPDWYVKIEGIT